MTLVAMASTALVACSGDPGIDKYCSGRVDSAAQTGNTFEAEGAFQNGQPILTLTSGGVNHTISATNYSSTTATFDITGLPKGVYTASWLISCNDDSGQQSMTSHVPTITIQ